MLPFSYLASAGKSGLICKSSAEEWPCPLLGKRGPAHQCSHSLAACYSQPRADLTRARSTRYLLSKCRQEARRRTLGKLRPGQATCNLLGRAGQITGLRSRIDQDLCRLPALGSHRQKATWSCASGRYYQRFLTYRAVPTLPRGLRWYIVVGLEDKELALARSVRKSQLKRHGARV